MARFPARRLGLELLVLVAMAVAHAQGAGERGGSASAGAAAWNRFRGPNGTGLASGTYPEEIGPDEGVLWVREFPEGHSSPVLDAQQVYLTGLEGEALFTYALARDSGETRWKYPVPRPRRTKFHPKNHPAAASCAADGSVVVAFFDEFGLVAYEPDGRERWRLALGPFDNVYGMGASPILVGDLVVLACDQSTHSFVLAVSKADGKERWRVERPSAISGHSTPVVRAAGAREEVILPGSFLLDAYDAASGERVWWVGGLPAEMKSVPVLLGDTLWIHGYAMPFNDPGNQISVPIFADARKAMDADGDGKIATAELADERLREVFLYFDLVPDGALDEPEWEMLRLSLAAANAALAVRVGGTGDRSAEAVLWHQHKGIPQLPSPLVQDGLYYMLADQGGLVTVFDAASGEQLAKDRLLQGLDAYYASPVAGDGKVYVLSESGMLNVLESGKDLEVLHSANFAEPCYATPALEDGRLWLRTHGHLYCFGAR